MPVYNRNVLTEAQITQVWESLVAAEARSFYFADMASRYTRQKQWITGLSFFFSTGAAATIAAKAPVWVPLVLSATVAAGTSYAIAAALDTRIVTMAKLHSAWNRIAADYERLWNHTYDPDSEAQLDAIIEREMEPSRLCATEAPIDEKLLEKWEDRVLTLRHAGREV